MPIHGRRMSSMVIPTSHQPLNEDARSRVASIINERYHNGEAPGCRPATQAEAICSWRFTQAHARALTKRQLHRQPQVTPRSHFQDTCYIILCKQPTTNLRLNHRHSWQMKCSSVDRPFFKPYSYGTVCIPGLHCGTVHDDIRVRNTNPSL